MRRIWVIGSFFMLSASLACGQQASPSAPSSPAAAEPTRVKVYVAGSGVTAPELLPLNFTPDQTKKCESKQDGKVVLSLLVNTAGQPCNIMFLHPLGTDLDRYALRIAAADRFNPGMMDGKPVVVAESLEVGIQSCSVESRDSAGNKTYNLRLRSTPIQRLESLPQPPAEAVLTVDDGSLTTSNGNALSPYKVGGGVSAPILINRVGVEFTDAAEKAHYQGTGVISLIVDAHGLPQNVQVKSHLSYGLEQNALAAVNRYRFKPAMKDGEPVPVMITVEVNFQFVPSFPIN